jgi:hypothetical protein
LEHGEAIVEGGGEGGYLGCIQLPPRPTCDRACEVSSQGLRWVDGEGGWRLRCGGGSWGGAGGCGNGGGVVRREEGELEDEEAPAASPERRRVSIDSSTAVTRAATAA